ncbi:hypothetical protein Emed_006233 [Eimeria media]
MRRMLARLALLAAGWASVHCISASAIRIDTKDVWRLSPQGLSTDAEFTDVNTLDDQLFVQPEDEAQLDQNKEESFVQIFGKKDTMEKRYKKLKKKFLKKYNKKEFRKFKWDVMVPALESRLGKLT